LPTTDEQTRDPDQRVVPDHNRLDSSSSSQDQQSNRDNRPTPEGDQSNKHTTPRKDNQSNKHTSHKDTTPRRNKNDEDDGPILRRTSGTSLPSQSNYASGSKLGAKSREDQRSDDRRDDQRYDQRSDRRDNPDRRDDRNRDDRNPERTSSKRQERNPKRKSSTGRNDRRDDPRNNDRSDNSNDPRHDRSDPRQDPKMARNLAHQVTVGNMMPMRVLGNTGINVSVLSFGFWATFGVKEGLCEREGVDRAKEIMRSAREAGVNFFDNAETYGTPQGAAEKLMGQALAELQEESPEKWSRETLVLSTKLFWGGPDVNEKGLSRKHLIEGLNKSLKRLRLDYVDIVFCHRPDPATPTETIVRGMTDLIRQGKCFAWGTSEWSAQAITEAFWIARELKMEPPSTEQPEYHMFQRQRVEREYYPLYRTPYNMGTTIWSPLASGLLTGKYNEEIPKGTRADQKGYEFLIRRVEQWKADGSIDKVRQLSQYAAEKLGSTVAQLALAWCIRNANVTTVLVGATSVKQLEENIRAIDVAQKMTAQDDIAIEMILNNKPDDWIGFGGSGPRAWVRLETKPMRIENHVIPCAKTRM